MAKSGGTAASTNFGSDDKPLYFEVGARVRFFNAFSVGLAYQQIEDDDRVLGNVRFSFRSDYAANLDGLQAFAWSPSQYLRVAVRRRLASTPRGSRFVAGLSLRWKWHGTLR